jgi:SAM-dependent methyltransferase
MTEAAEWIGKVGEAWAAEWSRTDRAFAPLSRRLFERLRQDAPAHGRALDIGCGAGEASIALAGARPELEVLGVDLSADLIAVARTRGLGRAHLSFVTADAIEYARRAPPQDLFLSRHGVMFFDDPVVAFSAFRGAAAPGAKLLFTCFRDWSDNSFASDLAPIVGGGKPPEHIPGPFAFADPARVRAILDASGWQDAAAEPFDFHFRVGEGRQAVAEAVDFLSRIGPSARALRSAGSQEKASMLAAMASRCEARLTGDAVSFPAAAWIWSAATP